MGKIRNMLFALLTLGLLFIIIIYSGLGAIGAIEMKDRSTLEGRKYEKLPALSWEGASDGSFQNQMESCVADHVPNRDVVMLSNAWVQRKAIQTANSLFGFVGYATYYGSEYCFLPDRGAIVEIPAKANRLSNKRAKRAVEVYTRLIEAHPNVNWVFCMPDRASISAASPLHSLVTNPLDYATYQEKILSKLPASCSVVDVSYTDTDAYFKDYFLTDHHWQIEGAIAAYEAIMRAFGKEPADFGEPYTAFVGPFWGSETRTALCPEGPADVVRDVHIAPDGLSVSLDGEAQSLGFLDEAYGSDPAAFAPSDTFGSAYAQWFHHPVEELLVTTNDTVADGMLLVIGDSFANDMERLFASSYHTVYHVDPRYGTVDVDALIDEAGIDDVVIMLNTTFITANDVLDSLE